MSFQIQPVQKKKSDQLFQLIGSLEIPLESFITTSEKYSELRLKKILSDHSKKRCLHESDKILQLLKDFIKSTDQLIQSFEKPIIYDIYLNEERTRNIYNIEIEANKISKYDQNWLLKFESFINQNIASSSLCVDDISLELSTTERQVFRKIKGLINITPNKYVRILKLHKARQIIRNYTYNNISQISHAVGYNDAHYFSQLFSYQYGITPNLMLNAES